MKTETLDISILAGIAAVGTVVTTATGVLTPKTDYFQIPMWATGIATIGLAAYLSIRRNRVEDRERLDYQL